MSSLIRAMRYEDDIEFENEDRARQREAEAAERARTHEAAARATEAATQASDAAAKAAQAASLERAGRQCRYGAGDEWRRSWLDSGERSVPVVSDWPCRWLLFFLRCSCLVAPLPR